MLQDGHKLPKFKARSRCGMCLGSSSRHADTIGRILNLRTQYVSPQFHVACDELFSTVVGRVKNDIVLDEKLWNGLLTLNSTSDCLDPDDRSNPCVMDHVQDPHDALAHDLDPNLPVSRGGWVFFTDEF